MKPRAGFPPAHSRHRPRWRSGSGWQPWVVTRHPTQPNRRKPFLTDNIELGRVFRQKFTDGLRRLVYAGKLKLQDEWAKLHDRRELKAWLDDLTASDWNVFIEGPPHGQSRPERRAEVPGSLSDGRSDIRSSHHSRRGGSRHVLGTEQGQGERESVSSVPAARARSSCVVGRCTFFPRATRAVGTSVAITAPSVLPTLAVAESCSGSRCRLRPTW